MFRKELTPLDRKTIRTLTKKFTSKTYAIKNNDNKIATELKETAEVSRDNSGELYEN